MKPLFLILYIFLSFSSVVKAQNPDDFRIDKCLVSSNPIPSGATFTYNISLTIPPGTQNLYITDQLSYRLGTSMAALTPLEGLINNTLGITTATVSLTGGTFKPCNPGVFGATIEITIPKTFTSGASLTLPVTVWSEIGELYECTVENVATTTTDNILDTLTGNPIRFLSNKLCFQIVAQSDWKIDKQLVGYIGVNVARYKIVISRQNPNNLIGYYNLNNVFLNDYAPAGAIVSIASAPNGLFSGPCIPGGNAFNCALNDLKVCDNWPKEVLIDVVYPCDLFPKGTPVTNCAELSGESPPDCNKPGPFPSFPIVDNSSGLCPSECPPKTPVYINGWLIGYSYPMTGSEVIDPTTKPQTGDCESHNLPTNYSASAGFVKGKVVANSNDAPGCQGQMVISICNNGNVPLTSINLTDDWPGTNLNLLGPPVCQLSCTGITYDYLCSGSWTSTFCSNPDEIRFNFPAAYILMPGQCVQFILNYEIPVTANIGDVICDNCAHCNSPGCCNCAHLTYQGKLWVNTAGCDPPDPFPFQEACACLKITVEEPCPRPVLSKQVVSPALSYNPGDIVRYRLCIANYGGGSLVGSIQDVLDNDLTFAGNVQYWTSAGSGNVCSGSGPQQLPPSPFIQGPFSPGGPIGVNLPAQCQNNQYATLVIEYDAQVNSGVPAGQKTNTATLTVDPSKACPGKTLESNATITVNEIPAITVEKAAKGDLDPFFGSVGHVTPGGSLQYKLTITNSGTVDIHHLVVGDWLPEIGNSTIISGSPLGSDFAVAYISHSVTPSISHTTTWHSSLPSPTTDLIRPANCGGSPPTGGSGQIMRLDFNGYVLTPGSTIEVIITCSIPATVQVGMKICNSVAVGGCFEKDNNVFAAIPFAESAPVCSEVVQFVPDCCDADTISVTHNSSSYQSFSDHELLTANFDLLFGAFPVQELRISIVDFTIYYGPGQACGRCYQTYDVQGTFDLAALQPNPAGNLNFVTPSIPWKDREAIYQGFPTLFSPAQNLDLFIRLPKLENIPCCRAEGELCLKFTFKDVNCNYCEEVVCIPFGYP